MRIHSLVLLPALLAGPSLPSDTTHAKQMTPEEFEAKLGYQTGTIVLENGLATLNLPASLRFVGKEGSRRLLVEAWGNPPDAADGVLGMIIPAKLSPLTAAGWGIVVEFDKEGYVDDKDAATIDYAKLLKQMQSDVEAGNKERQKAGYPPVHLVGWAEPPRYDAATHKLYWAKELAFEGDSAHTLNYSIRILGRRGVLVLNAVGHMGQLALMRQETPSILAAVDFNQGNRYADFDPAIDKKAEYGIAGLILGAVAAKAGLFKALWVGILALKKVIIAGIAGASAFLKRKFWKKKAQEQAAE